MLAGLALSLATMTGANAPNPLMLSNGAVQPLPAPMVAQARETVVVRGLLSYRERIALPPNAVAIVEIRETSEAKGTLIAVQRIELKGRQVPIPFALEVDTRRLEAGRTYALRGGIVIDGRPTWATEPVPVNPAGIPSDVGNLRLTAFRPAGFVSQLQCGDQPVSIGFRQNQMRLQVGSQTWWMNPVPAASGTQFVAVNDPTTTFWGKDRTATVVVAGKPLPECMPRDRRAAETSSFQARGHEPSWLLEVSGTELTLDLNFGNVRLVAPNVTRQRAAGLTRYLATAGDRPIAVTVRDEICTDSMSGMPFPSRVTVRVGDQSLQGCGGSPTSLLQGATWVVEDINGKGVIDNSRVTLTFGPDSRVAGLGSCNNYTGGYTLTGESLKIRQVASTMKACAPALMNQEMAFFQVLQDVQRFEVRPDGAQVLLTGNGRSLLARKASPSS